MKTDYDNLKAINEKQNRELKSLQKNAKDLTKKSTEEAIKLDGVDHYSTYTLIRTKIVHRKMKINQFAFHVMELKIWSIHFNQILMLMG